MAVLLEELDLHRLSALPWSVLAVRAHVAGGLDHVRDLGLPGCIHARARGGPAEVHAAVGDHRAVPHELPPARAGVARPAQPARGDPAGAPERARAGHRPEHRLDVQQHVRDVPHPRVRLGPVRRAPGLRLAREPRPAPAGGVERPGGEPVADVPQRDAAAVGPGRHRRVRVRADPDARRVHHAAARRRPRRADVRQRDPGLLLSVVQLAARIRDGHVPDPRGGDPARDLRPVPERADGGGVNPAVSTGGRRGLWAFFALLVVFLYAPIVILIIFSFNDREIVSFPWEGFTFRWYQEFLSNGTILSALKTS